MQLYIFGRISRDSRSQSICKYSLIIRRNSSLCTTVNLSYALCNRFPHGKAYSYVLEMRFLLYSLKSDAFLFSFLWVSSHMSVLGNITADNIASFGPSHTNDCALISIDLRAIDKKHSVRNNSIFLIKINIVNNLSCTYVGVTIS